MNLSSALPVYPRLHVSVQARQRFARLRVGKLAARFFFRLLCPCGHCIFFA